MMETVVTPVMEFLDTVPGWAWGVITPALVFGIRYAVKLICPTKDARTKVFDAIRAELSMSNVTVWRSAIKANTNNVHTLTSPKFGIEYTEDGNLTSVIAVNDPARGQLLALLYPKHKTRLLKRCQKLTAEMNAVAAWNAQDAANKRAEAEAAAALKSVS